MFALMVTRCVLTADKYETRKHMREEHGSSLCKGEIRLLVFHIRTELTEIAEAYSIERRHTDINSPVNIAIHSFIHLYRQTQTPRIAEALVHEKDDVNFSLFMAWLCGEAAYTTASLCATYIVSSVSTLFATRMRVARVCVCVSRIHAYPFSFYRIRRIRMAFEEMKNGLECHFC